jgi:hypothetical protein
MAYIIEDAMGQRTEVKTRSDATRRFRRHSDITTLIQTSEYRFDVIAQRPPTTAERCAFNTGRTTHCKNKPAVTVIHPNGHSDIRCRGCGEVERRKGALIVGPVPRTIVKKIVEA